MPTKLVTLNVVARLHAASDQTVLVKRKALNPKGGVLPLRRLECMLGMLPGRLLVPSSAIHPTATECYDALQPLVHSHGGGTGGGYEFDIQGPIPEIPGHYYAGGVWTSGNGHSFLVTTGHSTPTVLQQTVNLDAPGAGNPTTGVTMDYLISVSWT